MMPAPGTATETGAGRETTFAAVRSVMSRVFGVSEDTVTETTRRAQIARWDSLNMVAVAIGLERRLGRTVDMESCVGASSVDALLDILCPSGGPEG
jgi:acyl carrier protein